MKTFNAHKSVEKIASTKSLKITGINYSINRNREKSVYFAVELSNNRSVTVRVSDHDCSLNFRQFTQLHYVNEFNLGMLKKDILRIKNTIKLADKRKKEALKEALKENKKIIKEKKKQDIINNREIKKLKSLFLKKFAKELLNFKSQAQILGGTKFDKLKECLRNELYKFNDIRLIGYTLCLKKDGLDIISSTN